MVQNHCLFFYKILQRNQRNKIFWNYCLSFKNLFNIYLSHDWIANILFYGTFDIGLQDI